MSKLTNLVKEVIKNNQYLTIASSDSSGKAWVSVVAYVYDDDYNFYYVSIPDSQHQQDIEHNSNIAFTIFDSHQSWGKGIGIQVEASVEEVGIKDIPRVTKMYFLRKYPYGDVIGKFGKGLRNLLKGKVYRFYKAVPTRFWYPDLDAEVDARVEVKL